MRGCTRASSREAGTKRSQKSDTAGGRAGAAPPGGARKFHFSPLKNANLAGKMGVAFASAASTPLLAMAKRKPNAAFMKPVTPDDVLAAVVGAKPLPRTELTKKLWDYIKKNKLQDSKVKTQINADDKLKAVFNGKKSVSMFEMTKLVSGHLKK
jgi:chromatin remodeling complex protein RSC6